MRSVFKGWCMVNSNHADGISYWLGTLEETKKMCLARAKEALALDGETPADFPQWKPRRVTVTIEIQE